MKPVRLKRPGGQNWATFLHTHAAEIWACDFLQLPDLFFRSLFAFFIIDLKSRRAFVEWLAFGDVNSREKIPKSATPKVSRGGEFYVGTCECRSKIPRTCVLENVIPPL
jgi:hypothetical protein